MNETTPPGDPKQAVVGALDKCAGELRRFVAARVPVELVDDVLQLAALRAVEGASSLREPRSVRGWLYRLHRNTITDTLRKQASARRWINVAMEAPEGVADVHHGIETCDCSVAQAQGLPPNYASVLEIVDVRGASLLEAAQALGISVNNATVRLHRARKALRKAMFEHCGVRSVRECVDCLCVDAGCCTT